MAKIQHKDSPVGVKSAHPPGYVQSGDPGAVGAYKPWVDTTGGTGNWIQKIRNAANAAWETIGGAGGPATQIDETGDPATITIGAWPDGTYLKRSGTAGVGDTPAGGGGGTSRPLVDPTGLSWSWVNQGSSTIASHDASLFLSCPASGSDAWHYRAKAVPAKPYTIIAHVIPALFGAQLAGFGVGWLDSGDLSAVLRQFSWNSSNSGAAMDSLKVANTFAEAGAYAGSGDLGGGAQSTIHSWWDWIKLTDTAGGNRTISVSKTGFDDDWLLFHSVATNDYLTPDRVCFGINPRNASWPAAVTIDSWEEL